MISIIYQPEVCILVIYENFILKTSE